MGISGATFPALSKEKVDFDKPSINNYATTFPWVSLLYKNCLYEETLKLSLSSFRTPLPNVSSEFVIFLYDFGHYVLKLRISSVFTWYTKNDFWYLPLKLVQHILLAYKRDQLFSMNVLLYQNLEHRMSRNVLEQESCE